MLMRNLLVALAIAAALTTIYLIPVIWRFPQSSLIWDVNFTQTTPQAYINQSNEIYNEYFAVVFSAPNGFDRRKAIRDTWLSSKWRTLFNVSYVFLLGDSNGLFNASLDDEISKFGDIAIAPWFTDSYMNLTYKTIAMLQLAQQMHNQTAFKYLLKTDDDTFVNLPLLVDTLRKREAESSDDKFMMGKVTRNDRPHRDRANKYFMSQEEYSRDTYPPFVHGPAYVLTYPAAQEMASNISRVPFNHLEDIYMALLAEALNLKLIDPGGFSIYPEKSWNLAKQYNTVHYMLPTLIQSVWNDYLSS